MWKYARGTLGTGLQVWVWAYGQGWDMARSGIGTPGGVYPTRAFLTGNAAARSCTGSGSLRPNRYQFEEKTRCCIFPG